MFLFIFLHLLDICNFTQYNNGFNGAGRKGLSEDRARICVWILGRGDRKQRKDVGLCGREGTLGSDEGRCASLA